MDGWQPPPVPVRQWQGTACQNSQCLPPWHGGWGASHESLPVTASPGLSVFPLVTFAPCHSWRSQRWSKTVGKTPPLPESMFLAPDPHQVGRDPLQGQALQNMKTDRLHWLQVTSEPRPPVMDWFTVDWPRLLSWQLGSFFMPVCSERQRDQLRNVDE